jgi:ComF family protein
MLSNAGPRKFDKSTVGTAGRTAAIARMAVVRAASAGLAALRHALPQACALCRADSGDALLCTACRAGLPHVVAACPRCALPSSGGLVCGACLATPPPYAAAFAAWAYAFPADRLLQTFKYRGELALAEPLAQALCSALAAREAAPPDRIVPIPLSPQRQRLRGFNHAREIARRVGRECGVPLADGLRRTRDTPPQAALRFADRAANVRGAFEANGNFAGLSVAIVDDVMTTGATLAAAANALLDAGAHRVEAWAVARTLPPGPAPAPPRK